MSRLYYELGQTQEEIAAALGINRPQVSRLLKQARATGVVEIRIVDPRERPADIGAALRDRFGLRSVEVAPSLSSDELTRRRVGHLAAAVLMASLREGLGVGLGDGASMAAVADAFEPSPHPIGVAIVPLCGGYWGGSTTHEPFRRIAESIGATSRGLLAPGLLDDRMTRDALVAHDGIREVTDRWAHLDVAMFGIGSRSWSLSSVGPEAFAELDAQGAIGEVLMSPFTADGRFVETSLAGRAIAIAPACLASTPASIAVASGSAKVQPILGALRTGIITTLVTDERTATAVLRAANEDHVGEAQDDAGSPSLRDAP
ncbi:MAG: helix-turn-helix domain-containing protein [Chloroflexi bacterium]|nr:helix-turn-helix domain-containing protein [Chloroflexota bacterium]